MLIRTYIKTRAKHQKMQLGPCERVLNGHFLLISSHKDKYKRQYCTTVQLDLQHTHILSTLDSNSTEADGNKAELE